jgi:hypothetical protein
VLESSWLVGTDEGLELVSRALQTGKAVPGVPSQIYTSGKGLELKRTGGDILYCSPVGQGHICNHVFG